MSQKVMLDEGGSVSVHTRIKDMCKEARNRLGYTNQDISNKISERFGIEDFSVNTVNNFFSERSKATTIYTTGYICAVLGISIDTVFGIENDLSSAEEVEFVKQLAELKVELRFKDQKIEHLEEALSEKKHQLEQTTVEMEHFRVEAEQRQKFVQPWVFTLTLSLLVCALIFIMVYLIRFDIGVPQYGIFRR